MKTESVKYGNDISKDEPDTGYCIGRNALRELLRSDKDIDKIYVARGQHDSSLSRLLHDAAQKKIPTVECDRNRLTELAGTSSHQGVICSVPECEYSTVEDILNVSDVRGEPPFIVICDGIQDPHNLGAVIRTAECAGAHGVIIQKRRSVGITSVVSKASAGALVHMKVARVTNLVQTAEELKERGVWLYAADMDGTPYEKQNMDGGAAFVFGSEGEGISRLLKEKCDFTVSIPLYGKVNSLNVSNAAAVILCECARRRHTEKN